MNMKRPLAFLLAAGMTLGLAACGGNGGTSGSGSSGSSGSADGSAVTLDLWAFNIGGFTEASNWDTILAAFNEQHPDITVNVTPINYQDGDQKLTSAITSNSGPDIIFEGPERIVGNYAREGLMVDLSDLWTESGSDIAEGISSVSQLDGTYYMYPLSVAAHCMAINYEVFEAAGALQYMRRPAPGPPTTSWPPWRPSRPLWTTAPSPWPPPASSTAAPRAATRVPALW